MFSEMNLFLLFTAVVFTVQASSSPCMNTWRAYEGTDCPQQRCHLSESQGANPTCLFSHKFFKHICCWDNSTAVMEGLRPSCPVSTMSVPTDTLTTCSPKANNCPTSTNCRAAFNSTTQWICCSQFPISHIWAKDLQLAEVAPYPPSVFIPWLNFVEHRVYNGDTIPLAYKDVVGHDDTFCSSFYGAPFNATNADSFYYHQLLFDAYQNKIAASAYMFAVDINGTTLFEATEPDSQCHTTNTDPSVYINNGLLSNHTEADYQNKRTAHKAVYMLFRTREPIGTLKAVDITNPSVTLYEFFTSIYTIMGKPIGAHVFNASFIFHLHLRLIEL